MITSQEPISLVGKEHALPNVAPLSPDDFRDLVKRRAVSILHLSPDEQAWENNEQLRKETENLIFEKIHRDSNLLPIDFLTQGLERAKATCRISTPSGFGTGFLIERGIVMTNNHVIGNTSEAEGSIAEFDYEDKKNAIEVKLKPNDLFITSPKDELDFTIVACETTGIEEIAPIKLLRNPATVTRSEYVNIIQHPKGRKKEIALQDNTVSYVYDKVIHYSTDTQEGASGAGVYNNAWQIVALHHAGWYKDDSRVEAVNEGIRISTIVSKLISLAQGGDAGAAQIIQTFEGSSPYLGFYDVKGLIDNHDDLAEVEVPTFQGDKRFADIGFWNIEHFNNTVQEQRINEVAKVVADLSMDAMGLVEVERNALDRLVVALKDHGSLMDYVYLDAEGSQDLAVLFDTTTTKVELRDDINLKYRNLLRTTFANKPAFPNQREPLFAICTVKEPGKDVQFLMIVVHLKAKRDTESSRRRELAAQVLSVIIEDLKQDEVFKHLPIVLGGDLNDNTGSVSLSSIMDSPSLVTLTHDDAAAGHISYLKDPFSLIDHIVISKDLNVGQIEQDDAAIVRLDQSVQDFVKHISDHAPLVLRVIYKDGSEETERLNSPPSPAVQFIGDSTLERTLLKLRINRDKLESDRAYYDEEKDKLTMSDYYRFVNFQSGNSSTLFHDLHCLLLGTHMNIFSYSRSRSELYAWVDLREDGAIRSIYSGKDLDPEQLIQQDYQFEQQKKEFLKSLPHLDRMDEEELSQIFEEKFQFNIEHVVPQSWFGKKSPMIGDLHHLFTCEVECNSFRGNIPYYDYADYNPEAHYEVTRNECGKRNGTVKFEPESGKGEVARAMLYFLLRYPGKIREGDISRVNVGLLLDWHKSYPVTLYEKHRNRAIFELQGNRNPLIDFPEYAEQINFTLGQ